MEILGSEFLEIVKNNTVVENEQVVATLADLDFKILFSALNKNLTQTAIQRVQLSAGELIEAEPVKFSIETEIINLPTRYANALEKIVDEATMYDINLYMVVEHPLVSRSGMIIQKAASLVAYLDNQVTVEQRMKTFFDEQLALIKAGGWSTLVSEVTEAKEVSEPAKD